LACIASYLRLHRLHCFGRASKFWGEELYGGAVGAALLGDDLEIRLGHLVLASQLSGARLVGRPIIRRPSGALISRAAEWPTRARIIGRSSRRRLICIGAPTLEVGPLPAKNTTGGAP